ncbi:hypothetical protein [Actinomadura rudentiformis]|uniref:Uncharacterized protein n=1 Tax=Actinomadura rudentiformis TaxID=359158 RepID=A0A6H9YJU9_9ACTN|nr:hypothetical protein [Actinomadura rudentiformis]KAB2347275.1 hypothetical protein F8566_19870 [Actinomadura rudentiformis]
MVTRITAVGGEVAKVKVLGVKTSHAKAKVGGECVAPYAAAPCSEEKLSKGSSHTFFSSVTLPKTFKKTTIVTLTVRAGAPDTTDARGSIKITYTVPKPPKPTPKPTPSPSLTPDSGDGPSDGKSGKSGSGSGSGNNSGSNGSNSGGNSAPYVPPRPNGTFNPSGTQSPRVALPPIAQPSPSLAPAAAPPSPNSRLRGNERPVAQDLTFERMASTQVAWLAALMVAFSLLLTQLRLGRRRTGPAAAPIRPRGDHRRPRRGVFGK